METDRGLAPMAKRIGRPRGSGSRPTATMADRMSVNERERLGRILSTRKNELRLTIAEVAERASISVDAAAKLLSGKQDNPEFIVLRAVSRALDLPLATMLGIANSLPTEEATAITFAGQAEVGVFRSVTKQTADAKLHLGLPQDVRYAQASRISITVMDDSLMGLSPPVPPGYVALAAVVHAGEFEIEHGRIYLIHRPLPGSSGGAIESAFRRASVYPDRYEFATAFPDVERNERDKIIVARSDLKSSDVEIGGIFFAAYCQYL